MNYVIFALLVYLALTSAGKRKSGETVYKLNFQKSVSTCDDFDNEMLDASGLVLDLTESGDGILKGSLTVLKEISEGVKIVITALKETDNGREFAYEVEGELCEHLADEDAPWSPLFQALGISSCPIEAKEYEVEKLQLNLDYAKDIMRHEFVSDYFGILELRGEAGADDPVPPKLVCYGLSLSVIEVKEDSDDDE